MGDHGINGVRTKIPKYKLENAVDMSTHLEEVIASYSRNHRLRLWTPAAPTSKQESEQSSAINSFVKEDALSQLVSKPSLNVATDNHSATPSLASNSSQSIANVKSPPKTVVKTMSNGRKRTFVYKFHCEHCDYIDYTQKRVNTHARKHRVKKSYKCNLCDFSVFYKKCLVNHKKNVHSDHKETALKCAICNEISTSDANFIEHLITHASTEREDLYRCVVGGCLYCGHYSNIKRHLITCHSDLQKLSKRKFKRTLFVNSLLHQCQLCAFTCNRKTTLRLHVKYKHSGDSLKLEDQRSDVEVVLSSEMPGSYNTNTNALE